VEGCWEGVGWMGFVEEQVKCKAEHFFLLISQIILMALFVLFFFFGFLYIIDVVVVIVALHFCMNVLILAPPRSASACLS
jgi:hypothetical protein